MFGAEAAHRVDEFLAAAHKIHVAGKGFNDHAGDFVAVLAEGVLELLGVVVFEDECMLGDGGRNACGRGIAEGEKTRARLHEERVRVAVVAALELDDAVAAREAAGESNGGHARFRAGAHEAHLFHRGNEARDLFGDFNLGAGGGAEGKAAVDRGMDGLDDIRIVVAEDHRTPGAHIVGEALFLNVPHVGALGALDEARGAAH